MIFLDMDGVLADFCGAACTAHGKDVAEVKGWDFFEPWGIDEDAFWAPINDGGRAFWSELPAYEWFDELVAIVTNFDPNFYLLTKPSHNADCMAGKMDWIHEHFGSRFRRYFFAPNKSPLGCQGRMLIDDSDANCDGFARVGGSIATFPQPWNNNNWRIGARMGYVFDKLEWFASCNKQRSQVVPY